MGAPAPTLDCSRVDPVARALLKHQELQIPSRLALEREANRQSPSRQGRSELDGGRAHAQRWPIL
jgi:hypothetical protein